MGNVIKEKFGTTQDGKDIYIFTLSNLNKIKVQIINYGGAIVAFKFPDKFGNIKDIVLGYDNLKNYEIQDKYIGCLIGRCSNRIKAGRFVLNGKEYNLYRNDGNNHLHGGKVGFDKKVWNFKIIDNELILDYKSSDGEEGYPGNLNVEVKYTLDDSNTLTLEYKAKSDCDTICNLTNHTYFNLSGHESGTILNHKVQLFADYYTVADSESLPTGEIETVLNTPLDLTSLVEIGSHIDDNFKPIVMANGYDHNFVIRDYNGTLKKAAYVFSDDTNIGLEVYTTLPGIQFYTGNYLDGALTGKANSKYYKRSGFCLESQYFPNAMEHQNFLQPILKKDSLYHSVTKFKLV